MASSRGDFAGLCRSASSRGVLILTDALSTLGALTHAEDGDVRKCSLRSIDRLQSAQNCLVDFMNSINTILEALCSKIDEVREANSSHGVVAEACVSSAAALLLRDAAAK